MTNRRPRPATLCALVAAGLLVTGCTNAATTSTPASTATSVPPAQANAIWRGEASIWVDGHLDGLKQLTDASGALSTATAANQAAPTSTALNDVTIALGELAATLPHNQFGTDMNNALVHYQLALTALRKALLQHDTAAFTHAAGDLKTAVAGLSKIHTRATAPT